MSCACCSGGVGDCPRCGTCSRTWDEGIDESGESFGGWFGPSPCSGAAYTDSNGIEYSAEDFRCNCVIAGRAGNYVGEVISCLCNTQTKGLCRCCFATYENGAWTLDEGCASTHGQVTLHGGGFNVVSVCTCPMPAYGGVEGQVVQLGCAESFYCDWDDGVTPNNDCED